MKIFIERPYATRQVFIWVDIEERHGPHPMNMGYDGENIIMETVDDPNKKLKPLLKMPAHLFDEFSKALFEEFGKEGMKTVNENHLEGKLQATETHLEDMRKITFKLTGIEDKNKL